MEHEAQVDPSGEAAEHPYDSSGVDVTLIRWMLDMTPAERLQMHSKNRAGSTARNKEKPDLAIGLL
jgi:hypothetical protein